MTQASPLARLFAYPCRGWAERLDTAHILAPGVTVGDWAVSLFCPSLALAPRVGDRVVIDGVPRTIRNVGRDLAGAMWSLLCAQG